MAVLQVVVHSVQVEHGLGRHSELAQVAERLVGLPEEGVQLQRLLLRVDS